MHAMPYLIKNSAGVWCVQRKVPEKLQAAVARVLGSKKQTQIYLKKSLGTKDRREATRRATHTLADLDRTLREAEALTRQQPLTRQAQLRATLNDAEIKRMGNTSTPRPSHGTNAPDTAAMSSIKENLAMSSVLWLN
jgi:hypothetical protein